MHSDAQCNKGIAHSLLFYTGVNNSCAVCFHFDRRTRIREAALLCCLPAQRALLSSLDETFTD